MLLFNDLLVLLQQSSQQQGKLAVENDDLIFSDPTNFNVEKQTTFDLSQSKPTNRLQNLDIRRSTQ